MKTIITLSGLRLQFEQLDEFNSKGHQNFNGFNSASSLYPSLVGNDLGELLSIKSLHGF